MKKGIFFSMDALIALSIIFFVIILAYPLIKKETFGTEVHYDVLETFSTLTLSELNDAYIQNLITTGQVNSSNKSIVEELGELYITNPTLAQEIGNFILNDIDTSENVGIWYDTTLIASKNHTPFQQAREIKATRQILSGIKAGENITGISARALLKNTGQTIYTYFGGYVGDGQLTFTVEYNGTISSAEMEVAINKNFDLYINNNFIGSYAASPSDSSPVTYTLPITNFTSGINTIRLVAENAYVAGGFVKVSYESSLLYAQSKRYYFPGITGIINLYDGIYIPGTLKNMTAYIRFNSTQRTFFSVGNKTIYNTTGSGVTVVSFTDAELRSQLNYDQLSNSTTPIRFGLENISLVQNGTSNADIILITDTSGSMDWRLDSDTTGTTRNNCNDPLIYSASTKRISLARCLDKQFVGAILGNGNNRLGLVAFSSSADSYLNLTTNQTLLNATIETYTSNGATCVSCAINRAYLMLQAQGTPSRPKYIVVMTDGVANVRSTQTCTSIYGTDPRALLAGGESGITLKKQSSYWDLLPTSVTSQINDIEVLGTVGFAVGSGGRILQWDGSSWSTATSPTSSDMYSVDLINATLAVAVDSSGRVLKWSGSSWSVAATISNNPTLYGVSAVNQTTMFAAGLRSSTGRIYRSINGGTSWTEVYNKGSLLRSIQLKNGTFGFAVGNTGHIAIFNGTTWTNMTTVTDENIYSIAQVNATTWTAVGGDNGKSVILRYVSSWATQLDTAGDSLRGIITNGTTQHAFGEGATLYDTTGGSWAESFLVPPAYQGNSTTGITCTTDQDSCSELDSYPSLNANYSSCRANANLGATVYSIGFGPITTCSFATKTLQAIASCGNGTFYSSSNATILQQFYSTIAQTIVQLSYIEQTASIQGNLTTMLFPDSYIEYAYEAPSQPYGVIVTQEHQFGSNGQLTFMLPNSSTLLDARVTSYSGAKWTKDLIINNISVYNLSKFSTDYSKLGDPFVLNIPNNKVNSTNALKVMIGSGPGNESTGSNANKLILTTARNASGYSPIASISDGCIWVIDFEDGTNATMRIPSSYNGAAQCFYQQGAQGYNINDAAQAATWLLLRSLDAEPNGKVDSRFNSQDVAINITTIQGIPYGWSTEVQVRTWR